jgi:hypothetical protein
VQDHLIIFEKFTNRIEYSIYSIRFLRIESLKILTNRILRIIRFDSFGAVPTSTSKSPSPYFVHPPSLCSTWQSPQRLLVLGATCVALNTTVVSLPYPSKSSNFQTFQPPNISSQYPTLVSYTTWLLPRVEQASPPTDGHQSTSYRELRRALVNNASKKLADEIGPSWARRVTRPFVTSWIT